MASGFSFGFSGDDIEEDRVNGHGISDQNPNGKKLSSLLESNDNATGQTLPNVETKRCNMQEMLSTLPSRISYTTTLITSPIRERRTLIPRRALFDVKMQIMAEDDSPNPASSKAGANSADIGLGDTDIETNIYEGGYKSWEGAMDLARLLLERGPRKDIDDLARVDGVIELGAGTALPTLILFQHALLHDIPLSFTLADYNASVLRLVTLPNLLLVWAMHFAPEAFVDGPPALSTSPSSASSISTTPEIINAEGDMLVSTELLQTFTTSLSTLSIPLTLISGPWSPTLFPLLTPLDPSQSLLVLGAETIYSPYSLTLFTSTLLALLRSVRLGKALVAAKRVYFGVGGSVDAFKELVGQGGGLVAEVENSGVEGCDRALAGKGGMGVGRCLLEVQMC